MTNAEIGPGEFYPVVGVGPHPKPWPTESHFDRELLENGDRRNVLDKYRYWSVSAIVADLDTHRHQLQIAIENWQHDLNIGSVVRTANAFNVSKVHIVGKRDWNRRGAMVTDKYLHVLHHPTVEEFKKALEALKAKGMVNLILDLQANGGGYLNRAYELADEFLSDGKKVVYTRGRTSPPEDYTSTSKGGFEKGKLAVLIDESSASASEIVSGAIQDWDRGLIIGRRSFGKGLVQSVYPLANKTGLALTTSL